MTYANAVLPHALLVAARRWPREEFLDIARASFAFLDRATTVEGIFWPVGNEGWHCHGGEKAPYDQQPVEAVTMAEAALAAWQLLGDEECLAAFRRTHNWFHGRNSLRRPLVDVQSGACYDGLRAAGLNLNQGAESTLAYLWTETIYLQECGNGQGSARNKRRLSLREKLRDFRGARGDDATVIVIRRRQSSFRPLAAEKPR